MKPYLQLIKMNITVLVVITSYLGYYLGLRYENLMMIEFESWIVFLYLIIGTFISSSGACILNQYFEVEYDKKMERTKFRPLPTKKIDLNIALILGILLSFLGPFILFQINSLTSLISFSHYFHLYSYLYSSKTIFIIQYNCRSYSWCTATAWRMGCGYKSNKFRRNATFWNFILLADSTFLSLAIIYKKDYERGGFKMLPVIAKNSNTVNFQIIFLQWH